MYGIFWVVSYTIQIKEDTFFDWEESDPDIPFRFIPVFDLIFRSVRLCRVFNSSGFQDQNWLVQYCR